MNLELADELAVLSRFPLDTLDQGLKIHGDAEAAVIAAAARLFAKGMLTHKDGGYLTDRGREAAEHWARSFALLTAESFEQAVPAL
ncbi:MAG: TIGR02647 family protein [Gammaproteobacteria bacterium]|nr:TIGR02647 family protein [Gammaproteobacteria bacterium]